MIGHIKPGTIVRTKVQTAVPINSRAVFLHRSGGCQILTDATNVLVADNEIIVDSDQSTPFIPMRLRLPYGQWTMEDGMRVLFSRDYCPMWRLPVDGPSKRADPRLRVKFKREEFFWDDSNAPWRDGATLMQMTELLNLYRLRPPFLVEIIPHLYAENPDIKQAAERHMNSLSMDLIFE